MHNQYSHSPVSHPTSVELYQLSNHSHVNLIQEGILIYVLAGLVVTYLCIKCLQVSLRICSSICEVRETNDNIVITDGVEADSDEVSESYENEEDYEPPEELQIAVETTITYIQDNNRAINKTNKTSTIEQIAERSNEEGCDEESENSEDLPSYYEVCVKPSQ